MTRIVPSSRAHGSFDRLATKLAKVVEDKRKSDALPLGVKAAARDSETENVLDQYRNDISKLREQNKGLKQQLIVSQQQIQAAQQMQKPATMYDSISSRIDTVAYQSSVQPGSPLRLSFRDNPNEYHPRCGTIFA